MLFDILRIIYRFLALAVLLFVTLELFTETSWKQKSCAAIVIIPLLLRVLMIR